MQCCCNAAECLKNFATKLQLLYKVAATLQREFYNYEHNYQPQIISEILQGKTLYQVSFSRNLLID